MQRVVEARGRVAVLGARWEERVRDGEVRGRGDGRAAVVALEGEALWGAAAWSIGTSR